MALTRREFLCRLGSFGAAALAMERFGIMDALAQSRRIIVRWFAFFFSAATTPTTW